MVALEAVVAELPAEFSLVMKRNADDTEDFEYLGNMCSNPSPHLQLLRYSYLQG